MITFELAKELKEAGYPQKATSFAYDKDGVMILGWDLDGCVAPTLSELIQACTRDCFQLVLINKIWNAQSGSDWISAMKTEGATPEEAVGRLWLALNQS